MMRTIGEDLSARPHAFSDLMRKHAQVEAPLTSLTAGNRVIMGPIVRDEIRYGTLSTTRVTRVRRTGIKRRSRTTNLRKRITAS